MVVKEPDYPHFDTKPIRVAQRMEQKYDGFDEPADDAKLQENEVPQEDPVAGSLRVGVLVDFFTILSLLNVDEDTSE